MLYRSTDRLCRRGAPVKNLSHNASFESFDKDAPAKPGTKHSEFLSYHIEAPYLPGEDAAFVYDLTVDYISQAGDAARRMVREPRQKSESGSSGF
jgi:hypothetical protein